MRHAKHLAVGVFAVVVFWTVVAAILSGFFAYLSLIVWAFPDVPVYGQMAIFVSPAIIASFVYAVVMDLKKAP